MKKLSSIVTLILVCVFLNSCFLAKQKKVEEIKSAEKQVVGDSLHLEKYITDAQAVLKLYADFISKYPDESITPDYLFKSGNVNMNIKKYNEAIADFDKLVKRYPKNDKTSMALFLEAFIYENNLMNYTKANELYRLFLKEYPSHEMAKSAKISLENIGKSPEEMLRSIEEAKIDSTKIN